MSQLMKYIITFGSLLLFFCLVACAPRYDTEQPESMSGESIVDPATAESPVTPPNNMDPVNEDPAYDGPIYGAPIYEEPIYEAPIYEDPVYEAPIYEAPTIETPAAIAPAGDIVQTGEACGGMTALTCGDPNEACIMSMSKLCGAADGMGVCTPRPLACTQDYRPVCGCDGNNYSNECSAHSAGVSAAYEGTCEY